jgi:hypothetical protein
MISINSAEDDDFKQRGVFKIKAELEIKITQHEMESDLVKRTEGQIIQPADLPPINEN